MSKPMDTIEQLLAELDHQQQATAPNSTHVLPIPDGIQAVLGCPPVTETEVRTTETYTEWSVLTYRFRIYRDGNRRGLVAMQVPSGEWVSSNPGAAEMALEVLVKALS